MPILIYRLGNGGKEKLCHIPKVTIQEGMKLGIQPRKPGSSAHTLGRFATLLPNNSWLSHMAFGLLTAKF